MNITPTMTAEQYRKQMNISITGGGNPQQVQRNRTSNDRGRGHEALLLKGCQYYDGTGAAVITKTYEPYICQRVKGGGMFDGHWTGKAEPDFKGTLAGGRSIVFEAKATSKSRIQHDALTERQMELLRKHFDMGAIAFVAVEIAGKFYSIPFDVWENMKKIYGKKFLMPDDIKEYEIIFDGAIRFLEYENGKIIGVD